MRGDGCWQVALLNKSRAELGARLGQVGGGSNSRFKQVYCLINRPRLQQINPAMQRLNRSNPCAIQNPGQRIVQRWFLIPVFLGKLQLALCLVRALIVAKSLAEHIPRRAVFRREPNRLP